MKKQREVGSSTVKSGSWLGTIFGWLSLKGLVSFLAVSSVANLVSAQPSKQVNIPVDGTYVKLGMMFLGKLDIERDGNTTKAVECKVYPIVPKQGTDYSVYVSDFREVFKKDGIVCIDDGSGRCGSAIYCISSNKAVTLSFKPVKTTVWAGWEVFNPDSNKDISIACKYV